MLWKNVLQIRSVREWVFLYLQKTWFASAANLWCTSGLTQKQGKLPPFNSFTEQAPTINNKCFPPMTWQVGEVYRISQKSSVANSSGIWYTELPKMSQTGWTGMSSDINQLLRKKTFSICEKLPEMQSEETRQSMRRSTAMMSSCPQRL